MTNLATLKLVAATKPNSESSEVHRRLKLCGRIDEQLAMAQAMAAGQAYLPTKTRSVVDSDSGLRKQVTVTKRVKPWWFTGDDGKLYLFVRYGARILNLSKNKTAVEVSNKESLVPTLETIKAAVFAGELDEQIAAASKDLRSGFKG
jgi:hypothetical protein